MQSIDNNNAPVETSLLIGPRLCVSMELMKYILAMLVLFLTAASPRACTAFVGPSSRASFLGRNVISRGYSRTSLCMKLQTAIVGLPNVGKSTLFNALTQSQGAESANYPFCTIEPNVG